MKKFDLRDLETGDVIVRNGVDRAEILKFHKGRYIDKGHEPKGWKNPKAPEPEPKPAPEPEPELADEPDEEIEE